MQLRSRNRRQAGRRRVAENPTQPKGWAVDKDGDDSEARQRELEAIEKKKRQDQVKQIDEDNRAPVHDENPAQPGHYEYPKASSRIARVFSASARPREGDRVLIRTDKVEHVGTIVALSADVPNGFAVEWSDGDVSLEPTSEYDIVGPRPMDQRRKQQDRQPV
jgi:hypothetical protein